MSEEVVEKVEETKAPETDAMAIVMGDEGAAAAPAADAKSKKTHKHFVNITQKSGIFNLWIQAFRYCLRVVRIYFMEIYLFK